MRLQSLSKKYYKVKYRAGKDQEVIALTVYLSLSSSPGGEWAVCNSNPSHIYWVCVSAVAVKNSKGRDCHIQVLRIVILEGKEFELQLFSVHAEPAAATEREKFIRKSTLNLMADVGLNKTRGKSKHCVKSTRDVIQRITLQLPGKKLKYSETRCHFFCDVACFNIFDN